MSDRGFSHLKSIGRLIIFDLFLIFAFHLLINKLKLEPLIWFLISLLICFLISLSFSLPSDCHSSQPPSNQFQFLLSTCKEKPKISKELEDAQRVDKSLFIQELLISSIENFLKHDLKFQKGSDQRISFDQSDLDDARPEGADGKARAADENKAKAADENKARAPNETKTGKEQQINCEPAASPNNHLPSGSSRDGLAGNSTNNESAKVATNGNESESQRINESNHQSNNQTSSNNQELNNQIAKGENSRAGANCETAASGTANNSEPVASNSVGHSVDNASSSTAAGTSGNISSNASDTVSRIKCEQAASNEPVEEPRGDQQPAK